VGGRVVAEGAAWMGHGSSIRQLGLGALGTGLPCPFCFVPSAPSPSKKTGPCPALFALFASLLPNTKLQGQPNPRQWAGHLAPGIRCLQAHDFGRHQPTPTHSDKKTHLLVK
jgi:hypothetical protein